MRVVPQRMLLILVLILLGGLPQAAGQDFVRGDFNGDVVIEVGDALDLLVFLYIKDQRPTPVDDAADSNDNGVLEIADAAYLLSYIFAETDPPPSPFPEPGPDPTPPAFPGMPSGLVEFRMPIVVASPGQEASIPVIVTSAVVIEALSQRIVYNPMWLTAPWCDKNPLIELIGGIPSFFLAEEGPPGVLTVGLVPDYFMTSPIPIVRDQTLFTVHWLVAEDAPVGPFVPVKFMNDPSSDPPAYNLVASGGQAHLAHRSNGGIFLQDEPPQPLFIRGDANTDGFFDVADPIVMLDHLFTEGEVACVLSLDANDDGVVNLGDAIFALNLLFSGGPKLEPPFPDCGEDPTVDSLGCNMFAPCR